MNFVIFMPDEMRAESLRCYGHPVVATPNIDRLAAQGTRFDQCHIQHPACTPSRCSLMTGWYPHVNGHRSLWHLLRRHEPHLFRYLHEAGYEIHWMGKNDLLAADNFDSVTSARSFGTGRFGPNPYAPGDPAYFSFLHAPYTEPIEQHTDAANVRAAIRFLESGPRRPFVLYLPLLFPHPPYSAPLPWHNMYDPAALPPLRPSALADKPLFHAGIRQTRHLDRADPDLFRKVQAVYLGMISYMDSLLGELLHTLDSTGLAENTTVLFFSDHGDWAGDYGLVEKWWSGLDDCITRVPLIVRTPGGKAGHVVQEPVELFDVMATVMELAGLQCHHTHFARSLAPQLAGAAGDPDRAVFCEGGYDIHEPHCFEGKGVAGDIPPDPLAMYYPKGRLQQEVPASVCRAVMIRTQHYKLIRRCHDVSELYDLRSDPRELRNVYNDPQFAAVRNQLETKLLEWYISTADQVPVDPDGRGLPTRSRGAGGAEVTFSKEEKK